MGFDQWSRRSLLLVGLSCIVFGVLFKVILFMKPEEKRPQIVAERIKRSISPIEREEESTISGAVERKGTEEKPSEGRIPEEEKPIVSKPPEPSMMIPERGVDEKVVTIDAIEADEKLMEGKASTKMRYSERK